MTMMAPLSEPISVTMALNHKMLFLNGDDKEKLLDIGMCPQRWTLTTDFRKPLEAESKIV